MFPFDWLPFRRWCYDSTPSQAIITSLGRDDLNHIRSFPRHVLSSAFLLNASILALTFKVVQDTRHTPLVVSHPDVKDVSHHDKHLHVAALFISISLARVLSPRLSLESP